MENKIILPRTTSEGKPRISYSQLKSWNSKEGFNKFEDRSISGSSEYILRYFLDYIFPASSMDEYAKFGIKCENYIAEGIVDDLTKEETDILDTIKTLEVFQELVVVDFGDFILEGYIDNCTKDRSIIRDFKTASKASAKQYSEQDYFQLDIYALDFYKKHGLIPQLEVVVIERSGSHFKPPLKVKDTFTINRTTSKERLLYVESYVRSTVTEISDCYKEFLKFNAN